MFTHCGIASVTALARLEGQMDLFVVGSDGRVWTMWWRDDNGRWASWYAIGGS